jgi:large subunit ribosomal protein L22
MSTSASFVVARDATPHRARRLVSSILVDMSGAASKLWRAVGGRARSSALASTSFARAAVVENLGGAWSTTGTRSTAVTTTVARARAVDGLAPFATRGARTSAGAFAESGNDGTSTPTRDEPGASPLRRAPAPASAMRGAFIPGALTDGGLSERASAVLRGAKGSPKKFGAFLRVVRGLRAEDALIQCNLSPKRVAKTIGKVIQSAIGNAVNNQGLDRDRLVVAEATCGKGQYLRRVSIHGRGRAGTMHRPRSHVRVTLEETDEEPTRRVRVHDEEMPWERRRRLGRAKQAIAEAAGIV